jgi:hypothetical protein
MVAVPLDLFLAGFLASKHLTAISWATTILERLYLFYILGRLI